MDKFRWVISIEFNDINIDHLPVQLQVESFGLSQDPLFLKNGFKTIHDCSEEYDSDLKQLYDILASVYDPKQNDFNDISAAKFFLYDKDDMIVEQWELKGIWPTQVIFGDLNDEVSLEIEWMFNEAEMTYHFDPEEEMQTVAFYRGERGNQNNDKLEDILKWSNHELEMGHDEIQWMFPSNEVSMMNVHAPVMTKEESEIFQNDPELRNKTVQVFVRYLNFLELKLVHNEEQFLIESLVTLPKWMRRFNHNMLRVTRMMKSLRLTGNTQYALALFNCLRTIASRPENKLFEISENTWNYWHDAVFEPLWNE